MSQLSSSQSEEPTHISVTIGAFTITVLADSEVGQAIARIALEIVSDPENRPTYVSRTGA